MAWYNRLKACKQGSNCPCQMSNIRTFRCAVQKFVWIAHILITKCVQSSVVAFVRHFWRLLASECSETYPKQCFHICSDLYVTSLFRCELCHLLLWWFVWECKQQICLSNICVMSRCPIRLVIVTRDDRWKFEACIRSFMDLPQNLKWRGSFTFISGWSHIMWSAGFFKMFSVISLPTRSNLSNSAKTGGLVAASSCATTLHLHFAAIRRCRRYSSSQGRNSSKAKKSIEKLCTCLCFSANKLSGYRNIVSNLLANLDMGQVILITRPWPRCRKSVWLVWQRWLSSWNLVILNSILFSYRFQQDVQEILANDEKARVVSSWNDLCWLIVWTALIAQTAEKRDYSIPSLSEWNGINRYGRQYSRIALITLDLMLLRMDFLPFQSSGVVGLTNLTAWPWSAWVMNIKWFKEGMWTSSGKVSNDLEFWKLLSTIMNLSNRTTSTMLGSGQRMDATQICQ